VTPFPLRVWRAALLHADTYEEVEADKGAIGQAVLVVALACAAGALSQALIWRGLPSNELALRIASDVISTLVVWLLGSAFAFMAGASFFRGPETETDYLEVLRTTGFAFGPGLLRALGGLPPAGLGMGIDLAARLWVLVAAVVALRQALDYTTLRAVGTFGTAAVLVFLVLWGLAVAPLPF
jgi:hypothetical protein